MGVLLMMRVTGGKLSYCCARLCGILLLTLVLFEVAVDELAEGVKLKLDDMIL